MTQRIVEDEFARKLHPVPGYESFYEINLLGEVVTKPRRANSPIAGGSRLIPPRSVRVRLVKGYPAFTASVLGKRHTIYVHRALALLFIPNPDAKPHINHIDGNKANFALNNLEWCTHKENMRHAFSTGLAPAPSTGPGEQSPSSKLTEAQVVTIKSRLRSGASQAGLAREYGLSQGTIGFIARGETWVHVK